MQAQEQQQRREFLGQAVTQKVSVSHPHFVMSISFNLQPFSSVIAAVVAI